MMRAAAFVLLVLGAGSAVAAQPIGRLFFTPAERAQLDFARANKRTAEPAAASQKPSEPPPPETRIITYNGIVRRSDGKSILWLNSHAADEKDALSGLPVSGRVRPDGRVTLQTPDGGGTIDLKVGQRAELQTGRVSEARPEEKKAPEKGKGDADNAKADAAKSDKDTAKADAKAAPAKSPETEKKSEAAPPKAAEPDPRTARVPGK